MKKTTIGVATAAALLAAAALTGISAHGHRGGEGFRPGSGGRHAAPAARWDYLSERLSLSDSQRDEIRGILKESFDSNRPLAERSADARRLLHDSVMAERVDESAIRKAAAAAGDAEADLAVARARVHGKIRSVLSPEQIRVLDEERGDRMERRQMRRRMHRERAEEFFDTPST